MQPSQQSIADPLDAGSTAKRARWHWNEQDVLRWAELFSSGTSVVHIASRENVAPSTVSSQLHKVGINIKQGQHHVEQLPLKYPDQFIQLVSQGPDAVVDLAKDRVWGIGVTENGRHQVQSFCEFIRLHQEGVGVKEIARGLALHRSTVAEWREGTDQPYIIRAMRDTLPLAQKTGWKLLPMHLSSGGNEPSGWIEVPERIQSFYDVRSVVKQIRPLETTYERGALFGLTNLRIEQLRTDLFAYLLGIMVGDSGKGGGAQNRFASMNLDLQLTRKHTSNERLGEFAMMCANSLGIDMGRKRDKPPSGAQLSGQDPTPAFRWVSERSPLVGWMFRVGLGLKWGETTTTHQLRMEWIFQTPESFRVRFVQGASDSDATVKRSAVEIISVPNAAFFAKLLRTLGIVTAHVVFENGVPLRTSMNRKQASRLPVFNEFVEGYRYRRMMNWNGRKDLPTRF